MIKRYAIAVILVMFAMVALTCINSAKAAIQAAPVVQVGQSYRVLLGVGTISIKVLEVGKDGLIKVRLADGLKGSSVTANSIWWLNLNQALLVEAK